MSEPPLDDQIDLGEPIRELARFEQPTSAGLLTRIRRSIQRRSVVSQLTTFSASVPLLIAREFWLILIEQLDRKGVRKDVSDGEKTS